MIHKLMKAHARGERVMAIVVALWALAIAGLLVLAIVLGETQP